MTGEVLGEYWTSFQSMCISSGLGKLTRARTLTLQKSLSQGGA